MMDPNTPYYYALSTIAQCAAALAALIGFLGLWRLDRLREAWEQSESALLGVFDRFGRAELRYPSLAHRHQEIRALIENPAPPHDHVPLQAEAREITQRQQHLHSDQQCLLWTLRFFLLVTLAILGAAVVGFLYVDQARAWVWTPWLLWIAGGWLAVGPIIVVFVAARVPRTLVVLALLFLTSTALAGPAVRCQTHHEPTLNRLQTLCSDGTRAISRYNTVLDRWETSVTPPAGKTCEGRLNPKTRQWEGRCR